MVARATEAVMAAATSTATPIEIRRIFNPFSIVPFESEGSISDPRTSPLDAAVEGPGSPLLFRSYSELDRGRTPFSTGLWMIVHSGCGTLRRVSLRDKRPFGHAFNRLAALLNGLTGAQHTERPDEANARLTFVAFALGRLRRGPGWTLRCLRSCWCMEAEVELGRLV